MTPYQAMYGRAPPQLAESLLPVDDTSTTLIPNASVQDIALQIKANLQKAQDRMKFQADKHRQLEVGYMVYLKLQPYIHTSLSIHICLKFNSRYYGPFQVLARIGNTSYKIVLPEGCHPHHTFHVSLLKKHLGPKSIPFPHLSLLNPNGTILIAPEQILERKLIPKMQGDISIPVVQSLIKWKILPIEQAT
jgi:hypothetical protein